MEVISLILSVVAITVIVYDFRQRKAESQLYNEQREKLESSMKTLSETNNRAVEASIAINEQIELINLKLSGLVNASSPNRRV